MSQQTTLVQMAVNDMNQAISMFSTKRQDGKLPLVLVPTRGACSMWMIIPDGVHIIMHKFGQEVAGYSAGLHILPPWFKVAFLVSKQACAYNAPVKNCPTADNVMVQVDLSIVFRITKAQEFVYLLGATKFDELLRAAVEEATRGLVRSITHDKIYELRGSRASVFLETLNKKFERFGVLFSDATITNVMLPPDLAQTLETETTYDSKQKEEIKSHQYQLKLLHDAADLQVKQQNAKNERLAQDEIAKKERALIQKGQFEIEAQRKKQLAIIKAEEESAVMKYKAESEFINSKIEGEKEANLLILKAEAESQANKIKADQQAQTEEKKAEAEFLAAQNRAKAVEIEAEAESKASAQLKEKREFDLSVRRLEVLERIAKSGRIIISGDNGDQLIQQITQIKL